MTKHKDVIVLGSGMSVLELSQQEIDYINNCEVVIAINKFMAFYAKSKILPTHVYYVDFYEKSVRDFLQHIFNVCKKDRLTEVTFILNKGLSRALTSHSIYYFLKQIYRRLRYRSRANHFYLFLIPKKCRTEFVTHQDWMGKDNVWATHLNEPLFHYRGSLSTVLNYVSIKYPNRSIKLVGVDFNSSQYFYQKELENLKLEYQDWTTPIVKKHGIHFSAINYEGTTIFDKFPFILDQLNASGNSLYSCSSKSLLVQKGIVEFLPLQNQEIMRGKVN